MKRVNGEGLAQGFQVAGKLLKEPFEGETIAAARSSHQSFQVDINSVEVVQEHGSDQIADEGRSVVIESGDRQVPIPCADGVVYTEQYLNPMFTAPVHEPLDDTDIDIEYRLLYNTSTYTRHTE